VASCFLLGIHAPSLSLQTECSSRQHSHYLVCDIIFLLEEMVTSRH